MWQKCDSFLLEYNMFELFTLTDCLLASLYSVGGENALLQSIEKEPKQMSIDTSKMSIGDQVRIKRLSERKNQTQLAAELEISRTYLSLYETGRLSVSEDHKAILSAYLKA